MVAIRNKLVSVAAALVLAPLVLGQAVPPAARPPAGQTAAAGDKVARVELRKLRGSVDALTKTVDALRKRPVSTTPSQAPGLEKIATNLAELNQTAKRSAPDSSLPWLMLLVSALISGAIAYFVARMMSGTASAAPARSETSSNGVVDSQAFRRRMMQDEKTERLATLSQIRAKLDELEADARMHAGVYMLMLAYRTARNAPLQRLAEISTREQEALLRYRSAAGQVVSLGYEYGRMPAAQVEDGHPDDLGAWLTQWWTELEGTLELDPATEHASEARNELFRTIRQKLQALMAAERETTLQERERIGASSK